VFVRRLPTDEVGGRRGLLDREFAGHLRRMEVAAEVVRAGGKVDDQLAALAAGNAGGVAAWGGATDAAEGGGVGAVGIGDVDVVRRLAFVVHGDGGAGRDGEGRG